MGSQQILKMFSKGFRRFSGYSQEFLRGSQDVLGRFSRGSQEVLGRFSIGYQKVNWRFSGVSQRVLKRFSICSQRVLFKGILRDSQMVIWRFSIDPWESKVFFKGSQDALGTSQEVLEFKGSVFSKVNQRVKTQFLFNFEFWSHGSQKLKAFAVM